MTGLHSLLIESAEAGLDIQRANGSTPAGHNGPYHDPETPARNTSHWLVTWSFAFEKTGDPRFAAAANRALDYLITSGEHRQEHTFEQRGKAGKDKCNGLIGPAFNMEALAEAGKRLSRPDALELAMQLAQMCPYDEKLNLFTIREVDGSLPGIDWTINHQIRFVAAVSIVYSVQGLAMPKNVETFVDSLRHTMILRPNGRIRHAAARSGLSATLRRQLREWRMGREAQAKLRLKEIAYHAFNLYGLAILRRNCPNSSFWASDTLERALHYITGNEYKSARNDTYFFEPYIPAGYNFSFAECALADQALGPNNVHTQKSLLEQQFARTFNFQAKMMQQCAADPLTQSAQICDLTRLGDVELDISLSEAEAFSDAGMDDNSPQQPTALAASTNGLGNSLRNNP